MFNHFQIIQNLFLKKEQVYKDDKQVTAISTFDVFPHTYYVYLLLGEPLRVHCRLPEVKMAGVGGEGY